MAVIVLLMIYVVLYLLILTVIKNMEYITLFIQKKTESSIKQVLFCFLITVKNLWTKSTISVSFLRNKPSNNSKM
jgi:hypothetical protein